MGRGAVRGGRQGNALNIKCTAATDFLADVCAGSAAAAPTDMASLYPVTGTAGASGPALPAGTGDASSVYQPSAIYQPAATTYQPQYPSNTNSQGVYDRSTPYDATQMYVWLPTCIPVVVDLCVGCCRDSSSRQEVFLCGGLGACCGRGCGRSLGKGGSSSLDVWHGLWWSCTYRHMCLRVCAWHALRHQYIRSLCPGRLASGASRNHLLVSARTGGWLS